MRIEEKKIMKDYLKLRPTIQWELNTECKQKKGAKSFRALCKRIRI
jgi:hypothetical protein